MSRKQDRRQRRRRREAPGAPPGSLQLRADEPKPVVRVLRYGASGILEECEVVPAQLAALRATDEVIWVSVVGLGDAGVLQAVAGKFGLHRLTLEDIVGTHQRPKAEQFAGYDYIVLKSPADDTFALNQLSVIVGGGFVLSFEEGHGSVLTPVRERIVSGAGTVRSRRSDFLAYALIDLAIDRYFPMLEHFADRIDALEEQVLNETRAPVLHGLFAIKEELRECRRAVWPLRDLMSALMRDDRAHFGDEARMHLRDCFDHVVQLMDLIESDRDTATGLMELHVSSVGNRMNEVMKVLTMIATLFIPLSFITSLYGMNFDAAASPWNMPELHARWGYPAVLASMLILAAGMLVYFRRKGWLGASARLDSVLPEQSKRRRPADEHRGRGPRNDPA